jgi:hypothetical protein
MSDKVIQRAAELMREQAAAYRRLNSLGEQLSVALVHGEVEQIESMTRTAEAELLSLRARLAQITTTLSSFAATRAATPNQTPISAEVRATFEESSNELIVTARNFQRTRARAAALAVNGGAFAGAFIAMCGVQPTTYGAPYARRGGARPWA